VKLKSLSDKKIRQLLKRFAWIYVVCLSVPFISTLLTTKAQGQMLLMGIWPAASLFYFLAYRYLAKSFKYEINRHLAFSYNGGGTLAGALYSLAKVVLLAMAFMIFMSANNT
jgi:ABC-type molybdate transport system substrate-binding protein